EKSIPSPVGLIRCKDSSCALIQSSQTLLSSWGILLLVSSPGSNAGNGGSGLTFGSCISAQTAGETYATSESLGHFALQNLFSAAGMSRSRYNLMENHPPI